MDKNAENINQWNLTKSICTKQSIDKHIPGVTKLLPPPPSPIVAHTHGTCFHFHGMQNSLRTSTKKNLGHILSGSFLFNFKYGVVPKYRKLVKIDNLVYKMAKVAKTMLQ